MAQVRKMTESEAGKVLALWDENCLETAGRGLSDDESANVLGVLRQYTSHRDAFCLVAEEQGQLVGFVTACLLAHPAMEGRCGEIEELYVQPHTRRHGIGSALVNQAVALLHEQGASPIRAHACADSQVAKIFWQHLGWAHELAVFSLCGEQRYEWKQVRSGPSRRDPVGRVSQADGDQPIQVGEGYQCTPAADQRNCTRAALNQCRHSPATFTILWPLGALLAESSGALRPQDGEG